MVKLVIVLTVLLGIAILFPAVASAHHTGVPCGNGGRAVCLPLMDRSAALATLNANHELTYCLNSRANNYPGFRGQVRQVLWQHEAVLGIRWREIPGSYDSPTAAKNAGCQVLHSMPEVHGCQECAAWVHYLNWPVLVEYRWQAGYNSTNGWFTTISHETGHIYGLHEHYDDANFLSFRGTYGRWAHGFYGDPGSSSDSPTVMDFGTGVWEYTEYDKEQSCQLLTNAPACSSQVQVPEWGDCVQYIAGAGFSCYHIWSDQWFWGIPMGTSGREMLHRWSVRDPVWRCIGGCP